MSVSKLLYAAVFVIHASAAFAQSSISLDSFDMSAPKAPAKSDPAPTSGGNDLKSCLLDPSNCQNSELKSGAAFSMDDVVNLKITDRESVPTTQVKSDGTNETIDRSKPLPSIDMEILFDYNSDSIRSDQFSRLLELSEVLKDPRFKTYTLAFIGHTDAKGSADYNRDLSYRRAQTVANFVATAAQFPMHQTSATGLGFDRLKSPFDPLGAQNRRVQLVLIPR